MPNLQARSSERTTNASRKRRDAVATSVAASSLLLRVESAQASLSPAERRVAEFVLQHPARVMGLSIAALARAVGVSEPTVARFCQTLGATGFKGFKLLLVKSLAAGVPYVHRDVSAADQPIDVAHKVIDRTAAALVKVRNHLDADCLARAVELLARAAHIEFYGQGNSGIVAQDAQHKFFRLGATTAAYSDPHIHAMAASLLEKGAVVVAISASGSSLDILKSVELARERGACVVGIAPGGSDLALRCDVILAVDVDEDVDLYSPMTSRIAHLAIIDALAVAVALARGPVLARRLEEAKGSIRHKHATSASSPESARLLAGRAS